MPRGANFSREELDSFLDIVNEILPISVTQWEHVAEMHNSRYPDKGRSVESLKRKFKELHIKQIPTGDPHCPPAVRRAKRLREAIIALLDGSDQNEVDDYALGDGEQGGDAAEGGGISPVRRSGTKVHLSLRKTTMTRFAQWFLRNYEFLKNYRLPVHRPIMMRHLVKRVNHPQEQHRLALWSRLILPPDAVMPLI